MKQIKTLVVLGVFAIIGFASLNLLLQEQEATPVLAAAGDVALTLRRPGDNQLIPGATVQVNCPNQASNIILTESPPASGFYVGSFIGQCNNGDPINADIQVTGYVDQTNLAFPGNYNPATDPDCGTNTQCLNVTNFQPGVLIQLQDAGTTPITGGSVTSDTVPCYEAPGGIYLCPEPETAGCPSQSTANASASGFLGNTGNYDDRCNGNDPQSQIVIQLAVDPNFNPGGSIFNILKLKSEDPFDRADIPEPAKNIVDVQITELHLQSTDPITVCPFQTDSKGLDLFELHIPNNSRILPLPGEILPPSFFEFENKNGKQEKIEFMTDSINGNWTFDIKSSVFEPNGPLLFETEYEYDANKNNELTLQRATRSSFFDQETFEPTGFDIVFEYDANENVVEATKHPDFDQNNSEKFDYDERDLPVSPLPNFAERTSCDISQVPPPVIGEELGLTPTIPDEPPFIILDGDTVKVNCPSTKAQSSQSVLGSAIGAGIETFFFSKLFAPGIDNAENLPADLLFFLACDSESTDLGLGERIGVINSFAHLFNRIPLSTEDWIDVLLIAHGSEPIQPAPEDQEDIAKSTFVKLFGHQANLDNPRDKDKINQLIFGVRPLHRSLEKEGLAVQTFARIFDRYPSSNSDWNAIRALAYGNEAIDLNAVDRLLEDIRNSANKGPCTEEEIAALNAQKAALEAEVASLEAKQAALKAEIRACNDKKDSLDTQKNDAKTKADQADKDSKEAQDKSDKADEEIKDLEKDIKNLQETLAGGDNVETKTTSDPLGGISSGAAITFDGGVTWVVATGESGAQQLAENLANNPGIVKDLQDKKNDLKNKKAERDQAEKDKAKAEQDKKDAEKTASDIEKQIAAKKADTAKKEADLDAIGKAIDALNAKIAEFNAVAARCDIAAATAARAASERLDEAKRKLDKMPPDQKEDAENEFDETATDAEKDADSNAGYGGGAADDAAEKLEEAMRNASGNCKEGAKICGESYTTRSYQGSGTTGWFQTLLFLRGGGLDADKNYDKMVNDISDGFSDVDTIDKVGLGVSTAIDALSGGSVLGGIGLALPGLVYGAWSDIATQAALNKIASIRNIIPNPTIDGHLHFYGGWDKYELRTYKTTYICEDGIFQKGPSELIEVSTKCEAKDPSIEQVKIPEDRLPDYSEKEDGNWRNPASITKFSEWRAKELEKHQPFGACEESTSVFNASCG